MDAKLVDSEIIRLRKQILNLAAELRRLPEETTSQLLGEFNQHAMPDSCFTDLRIAALFPQENPNPVIRLAMDGRLLFSNRAAEPLLSADCLQNQAVPSFFAQIDLAFSQTKPIQQLEYHAEGRVYTLDVVPVVEHNCINVYGRDITHQKQVESTREHLLAENSRQQALLDAIFETEPSGLAVIAGSDLRFVYANSAYRFLCPPAKGDPIGHTYDDVWAGILPETYTSQVREALETGRPFLIKGFERRFPDGTTRIFTLQIRRLQWGREPAALLILWDTTELTLSETRYRDLADSITDNFVAYDQNLRCVFRNNSSTMYSHIAPSAMVGKSFEELFPGMVGGALHKAYLQVLSDHQPTTVETDWTNPNDGQTSTWDVSIYPNQDGISVFSRDITRRKRIESELKLSQEHLLILSEAASDLLAGADPVDRINEFFTNIAGKLGLEIYVQYNLAREGDHLDLGSWGGFPEKYHRLLERLELGQAVCGTVAQTQQRIIVEDVQHNQDRKTALIRKLGIRTYVCHPLIANGRLLGTLSFGSRKYDRLPAETIELLRTFCFLVASAMDRKQTEQEMQDREKKSIDLLRNTNAVIYEVDFRTGRFTSFNEALCLLSGYSRTEVEKLTAFDLLTEESQLRFRERIRRWMGGEKPENLVEYEVRGKDGRILHALLNTYFKRDTEGKPLGAMVVAQDITELRQMEENLHQLEAEQAEYRTQVDVQRRLLAQREEERLQIARDLHDGPAQELIAATFSLQGLIERTSDPSTRQELQDLQTRISQQVAELRTYAGQLRPPILDKFGFIPAVKSHASAFEEKHPHIQVSIESNGSEDKIPPEIRLALYRITQEAMSNAAKHSGAGRVCIHLETIDGLLRLVIDDDGCGFTPPADWLTLAHGGHLGLVGMRERAEAIGGKLLITERPEGGTRLVVEAPV